MASHGKPDIVRVVSDLDMVMLSYSGFLMVELIRLNGVAGDDKDYLDLNRSEPETGSGTLSVTGRGIDSETS